MDISTERNKSLVGERIALRPVEPRDLDLIVRWRNDPRVLHSFFSPFLIHPAGQMKWFNDLQHDPCRLVFMIESREGKTFGMIGLDNIDRENRQSESGFLLMDPDHTYTVGLIEACVVLTRFAFEELGMHHLYSITFSDRFPGDWFEFTGWQREVVLRQSVFIGGEFRDKIIWGVLREDWLNAMYGETQGTVAGGPS